MCLFQIWRNLIDPANVFEKRPALKIITRSIVSLVFTKIDHNSYNMQWTTIRLLFDQGDISPKNSLNTGKYLICHI